MNSTQPFARSCAFLLMCFLCIVHLLMTLSFLIDRKLFAPVLPLSLILAVVISYFYCIKNGMQRKDWYKVLGVSLLVVLFSVFFAFFFFDFSWDGQWYHQAAVYNMTEGWNPLLQPISSFDKHNDLSIIHFPKVSWYFAAAALSLFGDVEAGKSINVVAFFAAALMVYQAARDFNMSHKKALLLSIITILNPVIWCEITTYLVDGLLYTFLLLYFATLFSAIHRPDKMTLIIGVMAIACLINTKFTGLVFYCFFAFCGLIYLLLKKASYVKRYIIVNAVALLTGVCLFGFNPYVTNFLERGHPFYPVMGTAKYPDVYKTTGRDDNEVYETPANMKGKSRVVRLFYAHFSRPGNAPYNKEKNAELMWPFLSKPEHWKFYHIQDVRMAPLGPYFSGLFLITLALSVWLFKTRKEYRWMIVISLTAILLTLFFNIHFWWVRLVPQLWLFPVIPLAILLLTAKKGRSLWWIGTFAVLIIINALVVLGSHMYWETSSAFMLRRQFREIKQKDQTILIRYGKFKKSMEEKLNRRGIKYIDTPTPEVRAKVHYNLASVVEGYPNMVMYRIKED